MKIKITKRSLLEHPCSEKVCAWYYKVQGRIINNENTKYKKFTLVVHFDYDDIAEFYEPDNDVCSTITKQMLSDYLDELIFCQFTDYINSYDDCKYFYELCNDSIKRYNDTLSPQPTFYW